MKWRVLSIVCFLAPILALYGVLFFDAWREGKLLNFLILVLVVAGICLWVLLAFWLCKKADEQDKEKRG